MLERTLNKLITDPFDTGFAIVTGDNQEVVFNIKRHLFTIIKRVISHGFAALNINTVFEFDSASAHWRRCPKYLYLASLGLLPVTAAGVMSANLNTTRINIKHRTGNRGAHNTTVKSPLAPKTLGIILLMSR